MNIVQMSPQVRTLGKFFVTHFTGKWPRPSVDAEMILEITALLEQSTATMILAFVVLFGSPGDRIFHLENVIPLLWDILEHYDIESR